MVEHQKTYRTLLVDRLHHLVDALKTIARRNDVGLLFFYSLDERWRHKVLEVVTYTLDSRIKMLTFPPRCIHKLQTLNSSSHFVHVN